MKFLFLTPLLTFMLYAQNYTYLIDEYDKVIDLEAKIISKIANDIVKNGEINLYIPNIKNLDKKIYSTKFNLVDSCKKANFVFIKNKDDLDNCKNMNNKHFFTNNYKILINDHRYIGAFFWSKSRPNIVLIKNRLNKKNIQLSKEYAQFIEDL
ncbi:MAG: hypothetical protein ACNI25_10880 [Halarcobacter sp.]